jgi:hypothetical protein
MSKERNFSLFMAMQSKNGAFWLNIPEEYDSTVH